MIYVDSYSLYKYQYINDIRCFMFVNGNMGSL